MAKELSKVLQPRRMDREGQERWFEEVMSEKDEEPGEEERGRLRRAEGMACEGLQWEGS